MKVGQCKRCWWTRAVVLVSAGLSLSAAVAAEKSVTFKDDDGTVFWTEAVKDGECAFPPADPVRFGCDFAGWSDGSQVKSYAEIDRLPVTAATTWIATYRPRAERRLRVGVYSGPGSTGGSALNCHRMMRTNPRIEYVSVQTNRVQEGSVMDAIDMFLIPGGSTPAMYGQLGQSGRDNIAKFVREKGGRYFGICAGTAFQANDRTGTHMGLAPFKLTAQLTEGPVTVALTEKGQEIFGALGWDGSVDNRICYSKSPIMSDAPAGFKPGTYHFDVVGTYKSGLGKGFLGRYAMVVGTNRLGRLFLTAPHPEVYESSRKFISTGIRWLFNEGVVKPGDTAEELRRISTGLVFTLPTNKVGALKVAFGPPTFRECGAEELLPLMAAIDQHPDYVLTPQKVESGKGKGKPVDLSAYDVLVVPVRHPAYRPDGAKYAKSAIPAFVAAGGKVLYADDGPEAVLRGLRELAAAHKAKMIQ